MFAGDGDQNGVETIDSSSPFDDYRALAHSLLFSASSEDSEAQKTPRCYLARCRPCMVVVQLMCRPWQSFHIVVRIVHRVHRISSYTGLH